MKRLLTLVILILISMQSTYAISAAACEVDMMLIFDSSGSIDNREIRQMKDAFEIFVDAFLPFTATEIGVVDFDEGATRLLDYSNDKTAVIDAINIPESGGWTNWEQALIIAHERYNNRENIPDVYIFASDGNPSAYGDPAITGRGGGQERAALAAAVTQADAIKNDGVRIIGVGIGDDLDIGNLRDIASPGDIVTSDFSQLAQDLADLVDDVCEGQFEVRKLINGIPQPNWEYAITVNGGSALRSNLVTDAAGRAATQVAVDAITATVSIQEQVPPGMLVTFAECQDRNGDVLGAFDGTDSVSGIAIEKAQSVFCVFHNTPAGCSSPTCQACNSYLCMESNDCIDGQLFVTDPSVAVRPNNIIVSPPSLYDVVSFRSINTDFSISPNTGTKDTIFQVQAEPVLPGGSLGAARLVYQIPGTTVIGHACPELVRISNPVTGPVEDPNTDFLATSSRSVTHYFEDGGLVQAVGPVVFTARAWVR